MAERFEIVEKALLKMLDEKKYASLRDILVTMNPSDVAGLFDGLEEKQIPVMFRLLPPWVSLPVYTNRSYCSLKKAKSQP